MGVELTVGADDTIAVEVVIAGICFVIVTAIGVFGRHITGSGLKLCSYGIVVGYRTFCFEVGMAMKALVHEVPVISPLELGILAYQIPIFL